VSGTGVSGVGRFLTSVGIGKDPDFATFALDVCGRAQATALWARSTDSNFNLVLTADSGGTYLTSYRRDLVSNTNMVFVTGNNSTNNTRMIILGSNGNVGIGTVTPSNGVLHVDTSLSVSIPSGYQYASTGQGSFSGPASCNVSIYSRGAIWTQSNIFVTSDERIKKNIQDISDGDALSKIRLIEPKTYQYVEDEERGSNYVYGFLAQQVASILPYSTTLKTKAVPDIYDIADVCGSRVLLTKDVSLGDANVHFVTQELEEKQYWTQFVDSRTLDVSMQEPFTTDKIFVYGRVVNDFHTLDKNAIYTVGIAALQEVDRQVQRQQSTIDQLTSQLADLTARLTQLEANNTP
jgi:hypothetical protein